MQLRLILKDILLDPKSGTTKVGTVEIDPENVDAELEALGKYLPGLTQSGDSGEESNLLSDVINSYCVEREVGGNWEAKTAESNRMIFSELVELRSAESAIALHVDGYSVRKYFGFSNRRHDLSP